MKIINAGYRIMRPKGIENPEVQKDIYEQIEESARLCYKSENLITDGSAEKMVRKLIENGHEAALEHAFMKVRFTVDRGISHELVRHRLASYCQESTRYCNYSKGKFGHEITVIEPSFFADIPGERKRQIVSALGFGLLPETFIPTDEDRRYAGWYTSCLRAERDYFNILNFGGTPQEARDVLPTSLKTEIDMTANMREWRQIFKLRAAGEHGTPHPQMLEVMIPLLNDCQKYLPALFKDIHPM